MGSTFKYLFPYSILSQRFRSFCLGQNTSILKPVILVIYPKYIPNPENGNFVSSNKNLFKYINLKG